MIKFLHLRRTRQQRQPTAGLTSALDRVREIREHTDWEPLTDSHTIHERAERVTHARKQITIPPLAHESESAEPRPAHSFFLQDSARAIFYGTALVVAGMCILYLLPEPQPAELPFPNVEQSTVAFLMPDSPEYASLTASQSQEFAQKALRTAGLDLNAWWASDRQINTGPEMYLHRISNYEATMRFRHVQTSDAIDVTVKLDPEDKYVLCTIEPK